jgi:2-polyprenyl-3-methyl-5-hydroxy-6-metoxy-1,4-benzoquinol methylase
MALGKYWAEPVPGSVYGNVIGILHEMNLQEVEIVDFGCGYGPLAEPLQKLGFSYMGIDFDHDAVKDLQKRGFKSKLLDLKENITENFFASQSNGSIRIALLLDVLEHFEPHNNKLAQILSTQKFDYLIISVPNVSNRFILNNIALNKFYYEKTGLLDETHLTFYTRNSLEKFIHSHALEKILENNTYSTLKTPREESGIKGLIKYAIISTINFLYKIINRDSEILQFVWLLKKV